MDDGAVAKLPRGLEAIESETESLGFTMGSDWKTGSLLRTLAAAKPGGQFLELGTGTGFSACWMLDGMESDARLMTVDNDESVLAVARTYLGHDPRISIHFGEGSEFLLSLHDQQFDLVFADAWPGKFTHLDETLSLLAPGGFYVIDDLLPQPNWPEDHAPKVPKLIKTLEERDEIQITRLNWSTGILIAVRITY